MTERPDIPQIAQIVTDALTDPGHEREYLEQLARLLNIEFVPAAGQTMPVWY